MSATRKTAAANNGFGARELTLLQLVLVVWCGVLTALPSVAEAAAAVDCMSTSAASSVVVPCLGYIYSASVPASCCEPLAQWDSSGCYCRAWPLFPLSLITVLLIASGVPVHTRRILPYAQPRILLPGTGPFLLSGLPARSLPACANCLLIV